jgi:hypothetical protein
MSREIMEPLKMFKRILEIIEELDDCALYDDDRHEKNMSIERALAKLKVISTELFSEASSPAYRRMKGEEPVSTCENTEHSSNVRRFEIANRDNYTKEELRKLRNGLVFTNLSPEMGGDRILWCKMCIDEDSDLIKGEKL